ncbi:MULTISPECIES: DoxX family protein [Paenibacillus]|uniref:DoxX family protein n=1 Tax=Paenibacillus xylanilyticus TaxID=248903 RepID=A0A7Y6C3A8_9BACL|nr:DoxX family protein [Paenibacillus xylanilyticus]NUU78995.1 DoxX family protein [Paenibacillus xylanilyticus]
MILIIIQILLALMFLVAGIPKFSSYQHVEGFKTYGYPQWFRIFTGVVQVITALLLIIGIFSDGLAAVAGALVVATMLGAIFTHIKMKDRFKNMVLPIMLLLLGGIVVWQNLI